MKKAINLVIIYFTFLLAGTVIGTFFYSFYLNVLNFIAGNEIHFFTNEELMKALFYTVYCIIFLVCPLVCYYRIRHPGGLPQTIAYIIVFLFTWLFVLPGTIHLNKIYEKHVGQKYTSERLSQGYFREADGNVYYFTEKFKFKAPDGIAATAVIIDTSEEGELTVQNVKDTPDFILNKEAEPYREVQIKRTFNSDKYRIPLTFKILIDSAKENFEGGILTYIGFLSIALLIGMCYGLTNFFDWKLLNTALLIIEVAVILFFNSMFYLPVFEDLKLRLSDNNFFNFLDRYINDPLLVFINVILALVIFMIALVKFIIRNHGKKDR